VIKLKIAVISDTHIKKDIKKLKDFFHKFLYDVDMIIHCGDFVDINALEALRYNNFIGVYGNVDDYKVLEELPEKIIISILNYNIGIFHGHGNKKRTLERAYDMFAEDSVDIILFGHSHQPIIKTKKKILMINPGSPMDKRKERWFSFVILELGENSIEAKLKLLDSL